MARPTTTRTAVSPGIRAITRTYPDGTTATKYQARVKRDGRLRVVGTYSTAKAADAARIRAINDLENGAYVAKKVRQTPFLEVAEHWLVHHPGKPWKPRTTATNDDIVQRRLKPLHKVAIGQVTYDVVMKQLTTWRNAGLSDGTCKRSYAVLKAILSDAVRRDLLPRNPCDKVTWGSDDVPSEQRLASIPEQEHVEQLVSAMDEPWALLVELAAYSGLRAGELAGLQVLHLNTVTGTVRVEQTVVDLDGVLSVGKPKSKAGYRTVSGLDPDLCLRLAAHVQGKRGSDWVFGVRGRDGSVGPYSHRNFAKRDFQPACKALGLTIRFHDLRHFYASLLISEGVDVARVAAALGHHDAAFTLRTYVHLFKREDEDLGQRIAARRTAARKASRKAALHVVAG